MIVCCHGCHNSLFPCRVTRGAKHGNHYDCYLSLFRSCFLVFFFFVFPVQNVYDHGIFQRHFLFHQYFHFIFIAPFLYYTIIRTWVLFVDTDNDKNIFFSVCNERTRSVMNRTVTVLWFVVVEN